VKCQNQLLAESLIMIRNNMTSASPNLKTAFKSVLKISASILLALLTFALLIAGYSKYESYIDKKDAAKYEDIKIQN
jgi:propanediol dehydratase large subunit